MKQYEQLELFPKDEYLENLQNLGKHIESTKNEMLDQIDAGGDYEERFNLQITCNGKSGYIELHADAYDRIMGMIETEISEYIVIKEIDENAKS